MSSDSTGTDFSLSVGDLEESEDEQLKLADLAVRSVYIKRVSKVLDRLHCRRQSTELAEQLLDGARLEDIIGSGQWEPEIANVCKEYQGLRDTTFLLIGAPKSGTCLSIEQDRQAREKQLDVFYNVITKNHDRTKCIKVNRFVLTYKNLKEHVEAFMTQDAAKSKRAYIVFNGHGKDSGHLSLEEESQEISNSDFIKDIYESWKVYKQHHNMEDGVIVLPQRVSVILAHCYGYLHKVDGHAKEVIDVVCLTNRESPKTKFVYKMNSMRNKVKDALHIELTNYARDVMKQESAESNVSDMSTPDSPPIQVWNSETAEGGVDPSSQSPEDIRKSARSMLDVTTLACLAFCQDDSRLQTSTPCEAEQDSAHGSFFGGIGRLDFRVSPKRLSDYFKKREGSLGKMVAATTQLACLFGGEDVHNATEPCKGTKSKRKQLQRQEAVSGSLNSLVSSASVTGMSAVPETASMADSTHKDNLGSHVPSRSAVSGSKEKVSVSKKDKKKQKSNPTGGISALIGLSSTLGQVAHHVDVKECCDKKK